MTTATRITLCALSVALIPALALPATAEEPARPPPAAADPQPPSAAAVPDAVLRAVGNHAVVLQRADGGAVQGTILSIEPDQVIVSTISGEVVTVPRASLVRVRMLDAAVAALRPATDAEVPPVPARPRRLRHVAPTLSLAPGFSLDLDHGLFHGFLNVGIVLPLASSGGVVPFSAGLGVGIPVASRHPSFKLDIFGYVAPVVDANYYPGCYGSSCTNSGSHTAVNIAFGVGLGAHHTWNNGLTLGFTVPILGYSVQAGRNGNSVAEATGYFYLSSVEALPMGYIGYRF